MIRFDQFSFTYPAARRAALTAVNATLSPGGVTLITGPLGAGCSTLLLAAAGLAPHLTGGTHSGTVSTLGQDATTLEGRRALAGRVALLLPTPWTQLSGMALTVTDEVAFGPANHGWPRPRIKETVSRVMERLGIAHLAERDPNTLSGGELQRVILAGLMAMEPEVYLLDEPALELDPAGADTFYEMLPELARTATVVIASTDVDRLVSVATSAFLFRDGRCVATGSPGDVLRGSEAVKARCSTTLAEIARAAGWDPPYPLSVADAVRRFAP
jgi:energy-coupling factor transporter ATP-binding protein EcfA2